MVRLYSHIVETRGEFLNQIQSVKQQYQNVFGDDDQEEDGDIIWLHNNNNNNNTNDDNNQSIIDYERIHIILKS